MQPHPRVVSLVLLLFVINSTARSQTLSVGASYQSYRIGGTDLDFKGYCPTLSLEYQGEDWKKTMFLDVSYFQKSFDGGEATIRDIYGQLVGYAAVTQKYSYVYTQFGSKARLSRYPDDHRLNAILGGGAAVAFATQRSSLHPSYNLSDDVSHSTDIGFHFLLGVQYDFRPVKLEFKGNLDIFLKPLVDDNSNIMGNLRLSVIIPILKPKD